MEENFGEFVNALPAHKAGLFINHNEHLGYYLTAAQHIEQELDREFMRRDEWPEGEIEKAIETNEIWSIQWYPDTPVGFCKVFASTLPAALQFIADEV